MSAFKAIESSMTKENILVKALEHIKPEWAGKMEVSPAGDIHLKGYQGDDRAKAKPTDHNYAPPCVIRIPKAYVGSASNDIGFARSADGTLSIYVSDYDQGKYGQKFLDSVKSIYSITEGVDDIFVATDNQAQVISAEPAPIANVPGLGRGQVFVEVDIPRAKAMQMAGS